MSRIRAVVKERVERSAEEADRVQTWLKSAQAKEFVRQSPELKESFSSAATAAKTLAKEQAEALSAEESALGKIKSQLAAFRVKQANPARIRSGCCIVAARVTITLRGAIMGVLAVALCIGLYLLWLWRPEHQARLHTEHFFHAIDGRNWESVVNFIGEDYRDQWDHDRARLLDRMQEGFRWVRGSRITAPDAAVRVETPHAVWIGKINVYSSDDGVMQFLDERVNRLPTPFELEWHHVSGKPWDWKLVRVSNPAFQIPADVN